MATDAVVLIWTQISEERFYKQVGPVTPRIRALLKVTGGPTRYQQGGAVEQPVNVKHHPVLLSAKCLLVCSTWRLSADTDVTPTCL